MREILFRGKPVVPGKYNGGSFAIGYYCCSPSGKHYIELSDTNGCKNPVEVNPDTVGQYTGLTDKNGSKIFEGDIVRRLDVIQVERETGKVGFDEVCCCFYLTVNNGLGRRGIFRDAEYEVIGNIHDNPEITPNCWR